MSNELRSRDAEELLAACGLDPQRACVTDAGDHWVVYVYDEFKSSPRAEWKGQRVLYVWLDGPPQAVGR